MTNYSAEGWSSHKLTATGTATHNFVQKNNSIDFLARLTASGSVTFDCDATGTATMGMTGSASVKATYVDARGTMAAGLSVADTARLEAKGFGTMLAAMVGKGAPDWDVSVFGTGDFTMTGLASAKLGAKAAGTMLAGIEWARAWARPDKGNLTFKTGGGLTGRANYRQTGAASMETSGSASITQQHAASGSASLALIPEGAHTEKRAFVQYEPSTGDPEVVNPKGFAPAGGKALIALDEDQVWEKVYFPSGVLTSRPITNRPPESASGGFTMSGLAENTVIAMFGPLTLDPVESVDTIGNLGTLSVEIPGPGEYQIEIIPPAPGEKLTAIIQIESGSAPSPQQTHIVCPLPLVAYRRQGTADADEVFDTLGKLIVTDGAAIPMLYIDKASQADAVLALGSPDSASPSTYPLVAAHAIADGITMGEAAQSIKDKADEVDAVFAVYERYRLEQKFAIRDATSVSEIDAAIEAIHRPGLESRLTAAGLDPSTVLSQ